MIEKGDVRRLYEAEHRRVLLLLPCKGEKSMIHRMIVVVDDVVVVVHVYTLRVKLKNLADGKKMSKRIEKEGKNIILLALCSRNYPRVSARATHAGI